MQQSQIKQHLAIVLLHMSVGIEILLARLLFHEHPIIALHQVHTSLHTEHLTEERRFQQNLIYVDIPVLRKGSFQYLADILLLTSCLIVKTAHVVSTISDCQTVTTEKIRHALLIWFSSGFPSPAPQFLVQHLTGKIS